MAGREDFFTTVFRAFIILCAVCMLVGCGFISNIFTYKVKTAELVGAVLKEDYDRCLQLMALESVGALDTTAFKKGLAKFRTVIVNDFGTELEYSFLSIEKKFSTEAGESTPAGSTIAFITLQNKKEYGIFKIRFDDASGKIASINLLDVKQPIPSKAVFWVTGLLAFCVPLFIIYVIVRIKRSTLKKKGWKYLAVACLNIPEISYSVVNGFGFKLLSMQMLFGFMGNFMGVASAYWEVGIPAGAIYWLWKLHKHEKEQERMAAYIAQIQEQNEVLPSADEATIQDNTEPGN